MTTEIAYSYTLLLIVPIEKKLFVNYVSYYNLNMIAMTKYQLGAQEFKALPIWFINYYKLSFNFHSHNIVYIPISIFTFQRKFRQC